MTSCAPQSPHPGPADGRSWALRAPRSSSPTPPQVSPTARSLPTRSPGRRRCWRLLWWARGHFQQTQRTDFTSASPVFVCRALPFLTLSRWQVAVVSLKGNTYRSAKAIEITEFISQALNSLTWALPLHQLLYHPCTNL